MTERERGTGGRLGRALGGLRRSLVEGFKLQPVLVPLYAILLSFVVGGILIAIVGANPFKAYYWLVQGMLGGWERVASSIARSVPYIGSALALAFAFRAGLFNIGAEGQLLVGGIVAAWAGTWSWMLEVPGVVAIPVILIAGAAGGALWGFIPGLLRATTGAHEVISTIMLNWIGLFMVRWLVNSRDPIILRDAAASVPRTRPITPTGILPEIYDSQPTLHWGLIVMLAVCVLVAYLLKRTNFGFETITVGLNPHAAHYAGMSVNKIIILSMTLSGAFAGLAAAGEVSGMGATQPYQPGHFITMGFDGIAIALLARGNPIGIIPASLLWGALLVGAPLMQQQAGVSIDIVRIIQSMVLLFVAADAIVRFIFRVRSDEGGAFQMSEEVTL
ncbi:MAG: ABC transporter permease [Actinobacteria bacterium]|nr:ABC transporter permease [Actinomycetota bacterium]